VSKNDFLCGLKKKKKKRREETMGDTDSQRKNTLLLKFT